jgi:hypothetical protein
MHDRRQRQMCIRDSLWFDFQRQNTSRQSSDLEENPSG